MKQSKDLSQEFNQAVFSSQNQKNHQRIQLALALGKKKSGYTTLEIRQKLRELDAEFQTQKMEDEVAKIHLFNNDNIKRSSKIVQIDTLFRNSINPQSARTSYRLKDMNEIRKEEISPYKMVMSQTLGSHRSTMSPQYQNTESLKKLKLFRESISDRSKWRKYLQEFDSVK